MARIPRHLIDEIRARTDLVALVERRVKLKQRGNSHVGLCPFHQEKTPSFHVIPHKQIYHCFGCGAGGDCFRFLTELEGLSFVDAVKELAAGAGVTIEERDLSPEELRRSKERSSRFDALAAASSFFHAILMTRPEGEAARAYLKGRGFSPQTAETWRLGVAPDGWTTTLDRLTREGFSPELLLDAGLVRRSARSGNLYDAFRRRLIIPITDERGRVIAFGGRLLEGEGPKYINSADGPTYEKSKVLFGLHQARQPIQQKERALLVEGYFDVISLHEAGFKEAIATCGTALTASHLETIRKLTGTLVALFDSDEAGARAAERTLPMCFAAGVEPLRLELPGAKDPDELIQAEGPKAMEAALNRTTPLLDWLVDRRVIANGGRTPNAQTIDEIVELLTLTEREDIVSRTAGRLKIHPAAFQQRVTEARRRRAAEPAAPPPDATTPGPDAPPPAPAWRPDRDQVHVLWLLVHRLKQVGALATRLELPDFPELGPLSGPDGLARRLLAGDTAAQILAGLDDPAMSRLLGTVVARDGLYTEAQAARGLRHIVHRWIRARLDGRIATLGDALQRALAAGDPDAQSRTIGEQVAARKVRNELESTFKADNEDAWAEVAASAASDVPMAG